MLCRRPVFHETLSLGERPTYARFPLRDAALEYSDASCRESDALGALRFEIKWRFVADDDDLPCALPPPLPSALEQLVENTQESALRMGSPRWTQRMLDTFPVRLDVRHVRVARVLSQIVFRCVKHPLVVLQVFPVI